MEGQRFRMLSRRELLRLGGSALLVGGGVTLAPQRAHAQPQGVPTPGCGVGGEKYPTSPLIVQPFREPLPIPRAVAPSNPSTWKKLDGTSAVVPSPTAQDSTGAFRHPIAIAVPWDEYPLRECPAG